LLDLQILIHVVLGGEQEIFYANYLFLFLINNQKIISEEKLLIFEEYVRPVYNMEVDISRLQGNKET